MMHTRVVWTLTAATFDEPAEDLGRRLCEFGVSAVLSVFDAKRTDSYQRLRRVLDESRPTAPVAFLFSLIGRRAFFLCDGKSFSLDPQGEFELPFLVDVSACVERRIPLGWRSPVVVVSSDDMLRDLAPGTRLSFGYGEAEVEVVSLDSRGSSEAVARVRVIQGSQLRPGMDVNSPVIPRGLFPLLPIDDEALSGPLLDVADGIVLHGIGSAEEISTMRARLGERGAVAVEQGGGEARGVPPLLLFRVDSAISLELMPKVLDMVDGVHLNRAELGLSIHLHEVPIVQKDLIARCNRLGEMVMVSSDLMASMRRNPNPTRAEVSDLANLVLDGVDAVVIGREVSEGPFASDAAVFVRQVIENSETALARSWDEVELPEGSDIDALAHGAVHAAEHVAAKAIVCLTRTGYTAGRLSSLQAPIEVVAVTAVPRVMRQVSVMRSVRVLPLSLEMPFDALFREVRTLLREKMGFAAGDRVVFVSLSASPLAARDSNLFVIEEV